MNLFFSDEYIDSYKNVIRWKPPVGIDVVIVEFRISRAEKS